MTEPDFLTPKQIAAETQLSYPAVLRQIRQGKLKACEPVANRYRVRRDWYEEWLAASVVKPTARPVSAMDAPRRRPGPAERGSLASLRAIEAREGATG